MSTKVEFRNAEGQTLTGDLVQPVNGELLATCLFAHCFTCTRNIKAARNISHALAQAGIAVLRFDFTGLGQSEGEFSDTNFSHNVDDLVAAADYLRAHHQAPAILLGHSLGGTAVLKAASRIPESVAVATVGAPADPAHVTRLFQGDREKIAREGEAEVRIGGRAFNVKKQFLDDLEGVDMSVVVRELRRPLLIMHSPVDDIVDIENAGALFKSALHPKSFVSLDKADHLLSDADDSAYAGQVLSAWASRYLPAVRTSETELATQGVVARTRGDGFLTEIIAGGHGLLADEPTSLGGTDLGPSPYDLLSAALAACTGMTLGMYARHKRLALDEASVTVRHEKIHAADCEHCETETGKIDRLVRQIVLLGDLSDAERQRLLEIADRCPVHRTLEGEIDIASELVDR